MLSRKSWLARLGVGGIVLSSIAWSYSAKAAICCAAPANALIPTHIVLVDDNGILPSQRPRYLSDSAGSSNSRFAKSGGENDWGLDPITPTEGIVTLKPGETYRTASEADLGARAAGATHGHAVVSSAVGMAE